jgi:nucleolar protein 58
VGFEETILLFLSTTQEPCLKFFVFFVFKKTFFSTAKSMLVLFETPAGYALFKCLDEGKLKSEDLFKSFENPEDASKLIKLKAFSKFQNTADAVVAATAIVEGKMSNDLKDLLKEHLKESKTTLAVADAKLGGAISKKFNIKVVSDSSVNELVRGIRSQLTSLITGLKENELNAMALGLSHSLSRYKLKFSPDKVDTMIVQAISLLDDLDKELNTYAMRVKEWYGWHFPELAKIIIDNVAYAKIILHIGVRSNAAASDMSSILPEELEKEVKNVSLISMGTEISDEDLLNIQSLATQIVSLSEYRTELYDYLKNRMMAIAPNLTCMVGELVGARLIAKAGSLMNLAKHPASTVQILGAEKALFRALKTKHNTPKYGLIYHASLVGQAAPKLKGKISRVLATKTALSVRCDALGDNETPDIGEYCRAKVEERLRQLEGNTKGNRVVRKPVLPVKKPVSNASYNASTDFTKSKVLEEVKEVKEVKEVNQVKESKVKETIKESESKDESKKKEKKEKKEEKKEKKKDKKRKREESEASEKKSKEKKIE